MCALVMGVQTCTLPISPLRIDKARCYGAELLFAESGADAVSMAEAIEERKSRLLVHPFDDPAMVAGAGTIALEMLDDIGDLEAIVVAVGGGGLAAGIAATIKQISPACEVYGVEPETADNLRQSLDARSEEHTSELQSLMRNSYAVFCLKTK